MIGMSNAQIGGNSTPFKSENIKTISLTPGQEIEIGSMVKVMKRDDATGPNGTAMKMKMIPASHDTSHALFGTFGKPFLSKDKEHYYCFALNTTAETATVANFTGTTSSTGLTYLRHTSWKTDEIPIWSLLSSSLITVGGNNQLGANGAWSWGEPVKIDDNYLLVPSQYGSLATAVGKNGISYTYPAQVQLIHVSDDGAAMSQVQVDYTYGRPSTISTFNNTGRPFILPIKENIGLMNTITKPNGEIISAEKGQYFLVKDLSYIMVYHCYNNSFTIHVRPLKVLLYDDNKYTPHSNTYIEQEKWDALAGNENAALNSLKLKLSEHNFEYDPDVKLYERTEVYKNISHKIVITIERNDELAIDNYYEVSHHFNIIGTPDKLEQDELEYFNAIVGGKNSITFTRDADDDPTALYNYSTIEDNSVMGYDMSFTAEPLATVDVAGSGTNPYPLYGHYCQFSNLDKQEAIFLTTSEANNGLTYSYARVKFDEDEAIWTTSSTICTPILDASLAKIDTAALTGSTNDGFIINSTKTPLVLEYCNNYNIDNVIRSKDKMHNFALFPYYYYDFKVDWETSTVKMVVKSLLEYQPYPQLMISESTKFDITGAVVTPTTTVAQAKNAVEWDVMTGNIQSSYCYNSMNASQSRVPFLFKLSDTAYLMSYLAPMTGFPGYPVAFASTYRTIVTKIINVIEDTPQIYSCSQYGWAMHGATTAEPSAVGGPSVAAAKPYVFTLESSDGSIKQIQMHNTYHSTNPAFTGGVSLSDGNLQKGVMDLWVYPVTSTKDFVQNNAYQKPLLYGVAASAATTDDIHFENKMKIYIFEPED